jgi:hypothetical protein
MNNAAVATAIRNLVLTLFPFSKGCRKNRDVSILSRASIRLRGEPAERQKIDLMPAAAIQRKVGSYLSDHRRKLKTVTGEPAA